MVLFSGTTGSVYTVSTYDFLRDPIIIKTTRSPSVAMAVRVQTMASLPETMAVRVQTMTTRAQTMAPRVQTIASLV